MTHFSTPSFTENHENVFHLLLEVFNGSIQWIGFINGHLAIISSLGGVAAQSPAVDRMVPTLAQHFADYFIIGTHCQPSLARWFHLLTQPTED